MRQDILADVLSVIKNAERIGKTECITKSSKVVKAVLTVLQNHNYIGDYEFVDNGRGGKFKIELRGKIIDCNVIKPRFSAKTDEFEKWEKRYLPAKDFGIIILSTPQGILTHAQAKEKNTVQDK